MKRFLKNLFGKKTTIKNRTHNRGSRLNVEPLGDRVLPSVTPLGSPIDVTGLDHNVAIDASNLGERTVARAENGNFAVVWNTNDANTGGVYYRLFNAAGTPLTEARQIEGTDPNNSNATISMNGNGEFAIAWMTGDPNGIDNDIYTMRFDTQGNRVGHLIPATISPLNDYNPTIALNNAGWLEVAYNQDNNPAITGQGTDGDTYVSLWSQAAPDQQGRYFDVASGRFVSTGAPSIAMNENSQGVISFLERDGGGGVLGVYTFTAQAGIITGRGLLHHGGESDYTIFRDPSVDINQSGTILVGYTKTYYLEAGQRGPIVDQKVLVDRWSANFATFLGEQQVLNSEISQISNYSSIDYRPSVALNEAGSYIVAARQELYQLRFGQDEPQLVSTSVVTRVFNSDGSNQTERFPVESTADSPMLHTQDLPSVASNGDGSFVVSYVDSTITGFALKARLFGEAQVVPMQVAIRSGNAFNFTDADGDLVRVYFAGKGGTATVSFTGENADGSDIASIVVAGPKTKGQLKVTTDGTAEVGAVTIQGITRARKALFQNIQIDGDLGSFSSDMNVNRFAVDGVLGEINASGYWFRNATVAGISYGTVTADDLAMLLAEGTT